MVYHDGAHYLPRTRVIQRAMLEFVRKGVGSDAIESLGPSVLGTGGEESASSD